MADETIPQMRDRIDKQNDELNVLRGELRQYQARDAFRAADLDPKFGDLFAAQADAKAEITPDAVKEFAVQYNLTPVPVEQTEVAEEQPAESSEPADTALASMSSGGTAGSGGAATAGNRMTRDDWVQLQTTDPVAARQALLEGRVELREDNFYVKNNLVPQR